MQARLATLRRIHNLLSEISEILSVDGEILKFNSVFVKTTRAYKAPSLHRFLSVSQIEIENLKYNMQLFFTNQHNQMFVSV